MRRALCKVVYSILESKYGRENTIITQGGSSNLGGLKKLPGRVSEVKPNNKGAPQRTLNQKTAKNKKKRNQSS